MRVKNSPGSQGKNPRHPYRKTIGTPISEKVQHFWVFLLETSPGSQGKNPRNILIQMKTQFKYIKQPSKPETDIAQIFGVIRNTV